MYKSLRRHTQKLILKSIKAHLTAEREYIPLLCKTFFYPTKSVSGISFGEFFRDINLEKRVTKDFLIPKYNEILQRYKKLDPSIKLEGWPKHYAIKLNLIHGVLANGKNIILSFPGALGIQSKKMEDYFSFELIDIWSKIFRTIIFPCMDRAFTLETKEKIKQIFCKDKDIEYISYLTSIFHEVGHHVGPWRIFPRWNTNKRISKFQHSILTELATDSLLVDRLYDFEEIILCVFLQRLFWFGRDGFDSDERCGNVNKDNDCWIGSYLWEKYTESGCIKNTERGLEVNIERIPQTFQVICSEINLLAAELERANFSHHISIVQRWMNRNLRHDKEGFLLPEGFIEVLLKCREIPYSVLSKSNDVSQRGPSIE
ncbi:MAG: hypothetical protein K0Q51_121 [Rickettsiaceae bacterium]|jgi:hypothetical protein|nr:hypothetical protein [Rickettsiaceae bacterium]